MPIPKKTVAEIVQKNPHLANAIERITKKMGEPSFEAQLTLEMGEDSNINLVYPVSDSVFAHIYKDRDIPIYELIEPDISDDVRKKVPEVLDSASLSAPSLYDESKSKEENFRRIIREVMQESIASSVKDTLMSIVFGQGKKSAAVPAGDRQNVEYALVRDNLGYGMVDSLLKDPYIEDITNSALEIFVVHKIFGNMQTNLAFKEAIDVDRFLIGIAEQMDQRISTSMPIAEGSLANGSRVAILFGEAISKNGSSFSMRKADARHLSITELVKSNTISSEEAAYLWMCIENGMSILICGESACGKTTMLKSLVPFIIPDAKIYSVEKIPELHVPHKNWQATLEKEGRAPMFDLLKASLRSRPDYIIVGQIIGKEGSIAFQAMQTGHPVMSTFHGSTMKKIIQRLSGNPINIPKPFLDNLNVVITMQNNYWKGQFLRRITSINEIEGYVEGEGMITRNIFKWDNADDSHHFQGYLNSYLIEEKIGHLLGYVDKKQGYTELDKRKRIIEKMVSEGITGYDEVFKILSRYVTFGENSLPFTLSD